MRRRLLQLLTALSILLAFATAVLWWRGYSEGYNVRYGRTVLSAKDESVALCRGIQGASLRSAVQVEGVFTSFPATEFAFMKSHDGWSFYRSDPEEAGMFSPSNGFRFEFNSDYNLHPDKRLGFLHVQLPHWFLVLLFSLLPAVRVIGWQVRRRRARQLGLDARPCPSCGYDRRATPTRCLECGHASDESSGRRYAGAAAGDGALNEAGAAGIPAEPSQPCGSQDGLQAYLPTMRDYNWES